MPFDDGAAAAAHALVPVIVFIPGGGWTSFADKRHYLQLALSLRKKGLAVVIPDIVSGCARVWSGMPLSIGRLDVPWAIMPAISD